MLVKRIQAELLNHIFIYIFAVVGIIRNVYIGVTNHLDGWFDLTSAFYLITVLFVGLVINFIFNSVRIIKGKELFGNRFVNIKVIYEKPNINKTVFRDLIGLCYGMVCLFLIGIIIVNIVTRINSFQPVVFILFVFYLPFFLTKGNKSILDIIFRSMID